MIVSVAAFFLGVLLLFCSVAEFFFIKVIMYLKIEYLSVLFVEYCISYFVVVANDGLNLLLYIV